MWPQSLVARNAKLIRKRPNVAGNGARDGDASQNRADQRYQMSSTGVIAVLGNAHDRARQNSNKTAKQRTVKQSSLF